MLNTKENTKMLKHENVANVGDTIRANDFAPREGMNDCFIEGKVLEKGTCDGNYYGCYKIFVTKKIVNGKDVTNKLLDTIFYVPFQVDFDEHDTRVQRLECK